MTSLTQEFIFGALDAEKKGEKFPIDFDDVWKELGYQAKEQALERLINTHIEGENYIFSGKTEKIAKGRPRKIFKLSVEAVKSFGMVSETKKGRKVRQYFISIEKQYREYLNRLLSAEPDPRIAQLENQLAQLKAKYEPVKFDIFPKTLNQLWIDSGIVNKHQVKQAVKNYFVENIGYVQLDNEFLISEQTYIFLLLSFRSERGCIISSLPEFLGIDKEAFFRFHNLRLKNKLMPHKNKEVSGQLALFEV